MTSTLIFGARGTVGSELAALLQAAGHTVLKATRAPLAAEEVRLDLATGQGLEAAFERADQVFFMVPPGHVNPHELLAAPIDAARRRGVRKAVLMSAMGADADPSSPWRQAELQLARSGVPFNVVRPNWFMQNFHTFWLQPILASGRIQLPLGQARGSLIDARDIAASAAALLLRSDLDGQAFDLTGAEALDHDEIAGILSRVAGREIVYEDIPPEAMGAGLRAAGLPADYAAFLLTILGFFKQGYSARITEAVQALTGRAPRRFEDYARDHQAAWRT